MPMILNAPNPMIHVVTAADATSVVDIAVYTVVLQRDPAKTRANLRAPVLICNTSNKAQHVVRLDQRLPLRHMLLSPPTPMG